MPQQDLRQSERFLTLYTPPKIDGDFTGKHIISVEQFGRRDLQILFDATISIRKRLTQHDRGLLQVLRQPRGQVPAGLTHFSHPNYVRRCHAIVDTLCPAAAADA